jgi:hypothetical protein
VKDMSLAAHGKDIAMDLVGDEEKTMTKGKMVEKWDRKKKKFVRVAADVDVNSVKKKRKNEAGQLVKAEKGKL